MPNAARRKSKRASRKLKSGGFGLAGTSHFPAYRPKSAKPNLADETDIAIPKSKVARSQRRKSNKRKSKKPEA